MSLAFVMLDVDVDVAVTVLVDVDVDVVVVSSDRCTIGSQQDKRCHLSWQPTFRVCRFGCILALPCLSEGAVITVLAGGRWAGVVSQQHLHNTCVTIQRSHSYWGGSICGPCLVRINPSVRQQQLDNVSVSFTACHGGWRFTSIRCRLVRINPSV